MSELLRNNIEIIDDNEAPPPNNNKFAPKYIPDPVYTWKNNFSYYNPYIGRRVIVHFGPGTIPQFDDNTLDLIAIDHYVQYNNMYEMPDYLLIGAIYHKLNERKYFRNKDSDKIKNVKMHYNVKNQSKVDVIADIASAYLADPKYNPPTEDEKIVLHAIKRAKMDKRFPVKSRYPTGGAKRKTRRNKNYLRKTRTKKQNI